MAIRNPSPEEIDRLLNKNVVSLEETKKEEKVLQNKKNNNTAVYQNELKPKKSRFEPDPIKCQLISGSNYIEDGFIFVRRLNTEEEAKLTEIKDAKSLNKTINVIFENAVKSNVPTVEMPIVDKLHVFSFILGISYGDKIQVNDLLECTNCRDEYPITVHYLKDLESNTISKDVKIPFKVTLTSFEKPYELCFNIPKIKDEDNIYNRDISEVISGLTVFLRDENGVDVPQEEWKEMMKWLSMDDKKSISECLNLINSYGDSFNLIINDNCQNPNCCMKNKKVKIKIEDIYLRLMTSISKK